MWKTRLLIGIIGALFVWCGGVRPFLAERASTLAHVFLGVQGGESAAEKLLHKAGEFHPLATTVLFDLAIVSLKQGDVAAAQSYIDTAIATFDGDITLYALYAFKGDIAMGGLAGTVGLRTARRAFTRSLQLCPNDNEKAQMGLLRVEAITRRLQAAREAEEDEGQ
jgi:hypothetical protein